MVSTRSRRLVFLLYLLPIALLWALVGIFLYAQHQNEKGHRADELNAQLQIVNKVLLGDLAEGKEIEDALESFALPLGQIRITLLSKEGKVLFDNMADADKMENHAYRGEIAQALQHGHGYTISRQSATNQIQYFYSATRGERHVLRSALPYTVSLQETLRANSDTWWPVIALTIVITIVFVLLLRTLRQRDLHHKRVLEQE